MYNAYVGSESVTTVHMVGGVRTYIVRTYVQYIQLAVYLYSTQSGTVCIVRLAVYLYSTHSVYVYYV